MGRKKAKANYRRIVLRLPDLDHSKVAVLNSLTSPASRRHVRQGVPTIQHTCGGMTVMWTETESL